MSSPSILILGGSGATGSVIARFLLEETDARLVIAGRRLERAASFAERLNLDFGGERVSAVSADAANPDSLRNAFAGMTLVLVASPTTAHVREVARAALDAGADYLDIHYLQHVFSTLSEFAAEIESAGQCFISQAGFHPGLPAVLARYAAPYFDLYETANTAMAMNFRVGFSESVYELIDESVNFSADIFKDGAWKKGGYRDAIRVDFGEPFGVRSCVPLQMEEIRPLPELLGVREAGVYVSGFNWFVDYLLFPIIMLCGKIRPGFGRERLARWLVWGVNRFSAPEQRTTIVLLAEGEKDGKPLKARVSVSHADPYVVTAVPVVASLLQVLDGSARKPGLWMMGHLVCPNRLIADMKRMGLVVAEDATTA